MKAKFNLSDLSPKEPPKYSYLKSDGSYEDAAEDPAVVVMTAADRGTGMYTAMSVPANNFEKDYL